MLLDLNFIIYIININLLNLIIFGDWDGDWVFWGFGGLASI